MIQDPNRSPAPTRRPHFALYPSSELRGRARQVAVVGCAMAALFAGPLRAEAGQPDAPQPTPPVASPTSAPGVAVGTEPGAAVPAPRVDDQLSLTGRALWDGLQDQRVILQLVNGAQLAGTIVAHSGADLAIARASDGAVVSVPKAEVAGVRARPRVTSDSRGDLPVGNRPLDSGRKLHGGGVALLSVGVPFSLAGTVMLGLCLSCLHIHLPLLLPGIALVTGGSIALKRSKQRNQAFRQAWGIPLARRMELTPILAFARGGGEVGFALRF
ncbi:hypothetical protein [Enhygromyxa salina]|uniref:Uncharacterized protein n=1 Tax=Enhygromyxa salina TaxID=215803 RepID=A0A2S9XPJ8_9BACT|nr:hypothetical protein [Enhygromyxa salina]PRP94783.1 hypothetical protein ENSA7_76060 [Enhygromyxa salina]